MDLPPAYLDFAPALTERAAIRPLIELITEAGLSLTPSPQAPAGDAPPLSFHPGFGYSHAMVRDLGLIESARSVIAVLPLPPDQELRLRQAARQRATRHSTRIEGNTLNTLEVGQAVLAVGKTQTEMQQEVRNDWRALEWIEEQIEAGHEPSDDLIRELHGIILWPKPPSRCTARRSNCTPRSAAPPWESLRRVQQQLLTRLLMRGLEQGGAGITFSSGDMVEWFGISANTAREWLERWRGEGFVLPARAGAQRVRAYTLAPEWVELLQGARFSTSVSTT